MRSSVRRPAPRGPARQRAKDRTPASAPYVYVFSRAAIRDLDERAERDHHIPAAVLMENAARHVADAAIDLLSPEVMEGGAGGKGEQAGSRSAEGRGRRVAEASLRGTDAPGVLVLCGPGNNGADGLAAARHIANAGLRVCVVLSCARAKLTELAALHLRVVSSMDIAVLVAETAERVPAVIDDACALLSTPDLLIDAMLGTGLSRPVTGTVARLVVAANVLHARGVPVLAVDIPTGLDADTGEALVEVTREEAAALRLAPAGTPGTCARIAVNADVTVTFVGLKRGFLALPAQAHLGDVVIADIGAPAFLADALAEKLTLSERPTPSARARSGRGEGSGRTHTREPGFTLGAASARNKRTPRTPARRSPPAAGFD